MYAKIANRTVADQYFHVTEKIEALYQQPAALPAEDEGREMCKLRAEMRRRMLGNGYRARPVELDCHFESICEFCTFFVTTIEFRPTLEKQRDDAADKGQVARCDIFDGLRPPFGRRHRIARCRGGFGCNGSSRCTRTMEGRWWNLRLVAGRRHRAAT